VRGSATEGQWLNDDELQQPSPMPRGILLAVPLVLLAAAFGILLWRTVGSSNATAERHNLRSSHRIASGASADVKSADVSPPQIRSVTVTVSPSFMTETAAGDHNARYSVSIINPHDYSIKLATGAINTPPDFALLAGLPQTTMIPGTGTITITFALHARRCGEHHFADQPIRLRARTGNEPWQSIALELPGAGPNGSWEAQVEHAACASAR